MRLLADFKPSYAEADRAFVAAAKGAGARLESFALDLRGPDDELLATRVAHFGSEDASKLLIVQSGTHGIEGYVGSAAQLGWIREGHQQLPPDVGVLLVHAINPHGFAWGFRETHERVDLNRNFVDFDRALPFNDHYAQLHEAFMCPKLTGPERMAADRDLRLFREQAGEKAFLVALASGQYIREGGLYYGGTSPTWSNRTFRGIIEELRPRAKRVAFIDLHSGLGPFGYGMPICMEAAESPGLERTREVFGASVVAPLAEPDSFIAEIDGHTMGAISRMLPEAEVTAIALEFGTYDTENDTTTYRDILWLRDHGEWDSPIGQQVRAAFLEHFCPADEGWREMTWLRAQQVMRQALSALSASPDSTRRFSIANRE